MPKAKKSSKASSPSWRTMLRQATALEKRTVFRSAKERKQVKARAAALREQANLKHRSERKAKGKVAVRKTIAKQLKRDMSPGLSEVLFGDNAKSATLGGIHRVANPSWQNERGIGASQEQPGHGEIVGGEMSKLADEIAALARKRGGTDKIQNKLTMATATARYEGEHKADQRHMQNVKDIHEATTDKVVCAALAVFDATQQLNGGLPAAATISGYTLARIIDALNRAGYAAKGKR